MKLLIPQSKMQSDHTSAQPIICAPTKPAALNDSSPRQWQVASRHLKIRALMSLMMFASAAGRSEGAGDMRIIAHTGQAGLTTINNSISINNAGLVAFSGSTAEGRGSFVADDSGPRAVRPINGNSQVGTNLQINDAGSIIARRGSFFFTQDPISVYVPNWGWVVIEPGYSESYDLVQSWAGDGSGGMELIAEGHVRTDADTLQTYKVGPFAGVGWNVTINNVGQVAFAADQGDGFTSNYAVATPKPGGFNTYSCTGIPFPMLADDGHMVFRTGSAATTPIVLLNYGFTTSETIASTGMGFTALGRMPGISDDGRYVAFYGDLSTSGAAALGTTAGPGIFLSYRGSGGRTTKRLVALTNADSAFVFSGFDGNQRVGLNTQVADGMIQVVFAGTNAAGVKGVWSCRLDPASPKAIRLVNIVLLSDQVDGIGPFDDIRLSDPINTQGHIACWARTPNGTHAVLLGRAKAVKHLHVLTHGFGNPSPLQIGPFTTPPVGFPDFLTAWGEMKAEIADLPAAYGTAGQQAMEGAVVTYVANWPSTDGWIQAVSALMITPLAPEWSPELYSIAELSMRRAAMNAARAADRIVSDIEAMGMLTKSDPPQIHLIGHSRGGAVNARVARLLKARGTIPAQYTALDGYAPDWPFPSNLLADLDIIAETTGIPGMRKVNVMVEDGFDAMAIRTILNTLQALEAYYPWRLGLPAPGYADATVQTLKNFLAGWKAPARSGFDNYVITGYAGHEGFTNHLSVVDAYTYGNRSPDLRALLDGPLGFDLRSMPTPAPTRVPRGPGGGSPPLASIRDGDFEALGSLADSLASKVIPAGIDPVFDVFLTALKRADVVLSASWDLAGNVTLVPAAGGYAARLEQTAAGTSLSQTVQVPAAATALEFDLTILFAKPGDTLKLMAGTEILGSVALNGTVSSHVCFSTFGFSGKLTTLSLRLEGAPETTPAVIQVDNIMTTSAAGVGEPTLSAHFNHLDRTVDLTLTGTPGRTFRVQASSDLADWFEIDSTVNFTGTKVIRDVPPAGAQSRFYRVVW
jgi:surfactin synthase thioesterase subunit